MARVAPHELRVVLTEDDLPAERAERERRAVRGDRERVVARAGVVHEDERRERAQRHRNGRLRREHREVHADGGEREP